MLKSIVDDIKREFSYGNAITRIIIVNIIIFVVVNIVKIIMSITNAGVVSNNFLWQFCFSSDWVDYYHECLFTRRLLPSSLEYAFPLLVRAHCWRLHWQPARTADICYGRYGGVIVFFRIHAIPTI